MNTVDENARAFRIDFQAWRKGRPQYKTFVSAIRDGKPSAEVEALAAAAGMEKNEVGDLRALRARAADSMAESAKLPAAEKKLAQLDAAISKIEKSLPKLSAHDYGPAVEELETLKTQRVVFRRNDYAGPKLAADCVALARAEGVM